VKTTRIQRHVVEKADAMIAQMVHTTRNRIRRVTAGIAVTAALAGLGGLLAADNGPVRLLGVTAEDDDVVIEASEPVAYSVTKPDPLTLLIDMRNVTVIDAANHVRRTPAAFVMSRHRRCTPEIPRPVDEHVVDVLDLCHQLLHGDQDAVGRSA
jgi:hypothetical protein